MSTFATALAAGHAAGTDSNPARLTREGTERRAPSPLLSRYSLFGGRRLDARREFERNGYVADQHGPWLFVVVIGVILMNILDAFYTVLFLSHGGVEMNPLIDWVLVNGGIAGFLIVKSIGIGVCLGFLTLTKNFTASRIGLSLVLLGYGGLMCWHIYLLGHLPT